LFCQLIETSGPIKEVVAEPAKIIKGVVDAAVKADAACLGVGEGKLQMAEETPRSREGNGHRTKLA
jgi:hypothetical protein